MKLDIFCEIQKRDCDAHGGFNQLYKESIEQAIAADKAGFNCWWEVEHHCTPDFSYSSCPELVLQGIAHHTERLRLGHSGILAPFSINHPLRIAERAAMMDHISNGRMEVGLAKSGGKEWETFQMTADQAQQDLLDLTHFLPKAWCDSPFDWESERWQVNNRIAEPKPLQSPHPPLWHTVSSPESFRRAGELGIGVLATTLFAPIAGVAGFLEEYRAGLAAGKPPAGKFINNAASIFTFVHVAETVEEAIASGAPRSAIWYVSQAPLVFNVPRQIYYDAIRSSTDPRSATDDVPMGTYEKIDENDINDPNPVVALLKRTAAGEEISNEEIFETISELDSVIIGDVETCAAKMQKFVDVGFDRLMCLIQMGEIPHEKVMRSIELIGNELIDSKTLEFAA